MDSKDAVAALSALAQATRLEVFRALVQAGPEGLAAGAISEALGIPSATLSFHLKELKNAGLVDCQCEGTSRIYTPSFPAVYALVQFLTANCCGGVGGPGATSARRVRAGKPAASAPQRPSRRPR